MQHAPQCLPGFLDLQKTAAILVKDFEIDIGMMEDIVLQCWLDEDDGCVPMIKEFLAHWQLRNHLDRLVEQQRQLVECQ